MNIEKLSLNISYDVILTNINIPDIVFKELCNAYDKNIILYPDKKSHKAAIEWLTNHISENMCISWDVDIQELK